MLIQEVSFWASKNAFVRLLHSFFSPPRVFFLLLLFGPTIVHFFWSYAPAFLLVGSCTKRVFVQNWSNRSQIGCNFLFGRGGPWSYPHNKRRMFWIKLTNRKSKHTKWTFNRIRKRPIQSMRTKESTSKIYDHNGQHLQWNLFKIVIHYYYFMELKMYNTKGHANKASMLKIATNQVAAFKNYIFFIIALKRPNCTFIFYSSLEISTDVFGNGLKGDLN